MITMIVGVITVVGLLVTRMPDISARAPVVPADLAMPAGAVAAAITFGTGWTAVVSTDNRILVFDTTGVLLQDIAMPALKLE